MAARTRALGSLLLFLPALAGCGLAITGGALLALQFMGGSGSGKQNTRPSVSVTTPTGVVNDIIEIRFRLVDPDPGDRASVDVEASVGGSAYFPALQAFIEGAEGTVGLETSAAGVEHTFYWNSSGRPDDPAAPYIGFTNTSNVTIRITPRDAARPTVVGQDAETGAFSVLNEYISTVARKPPTDIIYPTDVAVRGNPPTRIVLASGPGQRVIVIDGVSGAATVVAGTGEAGFNGSGIPGDTAQLNFPLGASFDPLTGDVYIADSFNGLLRRIDSGSGFITSVAGQGSSQDEDVQAPFSAIFPRALTFDGSGNPYILTGDRRVRVINRSATGNITYALGLIGTCNTFPITTVQPSRILSAVAQVDCSLGTSALIADLVAPVAFAVSASVAAGSPQGVVYILDQGGPTGAGGGSVAGATLDAVNLGPGARTFYSGGSTVVINAGDIGTVASAAPLAALPSIGDLCDLAVDGTGEIVYLVNFTDHQVFCLNLSAGSVTVAGTSVASGAIVTVAGTGTAGFWGDGYAPTQAEVWAPTAVTTDASGNIYLAEGSGRLRVINNNPGAPLTIAGTTVPAGSVGTIPVVPPGTEPAVIHPLFCGAGLAGDLLVTDVEIGDPRSLRIFSLSRDDGTLATLAGNGTYGYLGDGGPATSARIGAVTFATVAPGGEILCFADFYGHRVRAVNLGSVPRTFLGRTLDPGEIDTVVGTGAPTTGPGDLGDGLPADQATLHEPVSVVFDEVGLLWIGDALNNRVRVTNPLSTPMTVLGVSIAPGAIQTVIGTGTAGGAGDGGPAASAEVERPAALFGPDGTLYILHGSDRDRTTPDLRVRAVNLSSSPRVVGGVSIAPGDIATVIGSGALRLDDDSNLGDGGAALGATFRSLMGFSVRSDGLAFVADGQDHRIRVANLADSNRDLAGVTLVPATIRTVIGNGVPGFDGNPATVAAPFAGSTVSGLVNMPSGVLAMGDDTLFFADGENGAVRMANLSAQPRVFAGIEAASGQMVVVAGARSGQVAVGQPVSGRVDPGDPVNPDDDALIFTDSGPLGDLPAVLLLDLKSRIVRVVAGGSGRTDPNDPTTLGDGGPALLGTFSDPRGVCLDTEGSVYVADAGNALVRFVNRASGARTPVAGGPTADPVDIVSVVGESADGDSGNDDGSPAGDADLSFPVDVDLLGGALWVADEGDGRLLRVDTTSGNVDGVLFTRPVTGGQSAGTADGTATFTDAAAVFVTDGVKPGDLVVVLDAGPGGTLLLDGNPVSSLPATVRVASVVDEQTLTLAQTMAVAGIPGPPWTVAYLLVRPGNEIAVLAPPSSATMTSGGSFTTVMDAAASFKTWGVAAGDSLIILAAGGGIFIGGVPATLPVEVEVAYVWNDQALFLDPSVAIGGGSGTIAYCVVLNGEATAVAPIDSASAYVATSGERREHGARVFRATRAGSAWTLTHVAGTGNRGWNGDHLLAASMDFNFISGLYLDGDALFLTDRETHRVVVVNVSTNPLSILTIGGLTIAYQEARAVAGTGGGDSGYNGDARPANLALLNDPTDVAVGPNGDTPTTYSVFVIDHGNGRIRRFRR